MVQTLSPGAIHEYVEKSFDRLRAGSMKDEKYLAFDPLGILGPALKQLGASNMESTFSLTSPDNTLRLVQVVTNQGDLGAHASQDDDEAGGCDFGSACSPAIQGRSRRSS